MAHLLGLLESTLVRTLGLASKSTKAESLAAPLRMMAAYVGADAEFVMYFVEEKEGGGWDRSKWMEDAKPAIKEANALANLPYVKTEDGTVITQSNACLSFLARRFKLMGSNEKQVSETEQLMCQVMDLRNSAVSRFYSGSAAMDEQNVKKHFGSTVA
eukprot:gene25211-4085_t